MRTSTTQIPLGTPLNKSHPLCQGLVGFWPLNEGGGQIANDIFLSNYGTLTSGAVYTKHLRGSCVSFDGVDDIVANMGLLTSYSFIPNTQVFTISLWVQLNNNTARQGLLATVGTIVGNKGFYVLYETTGGASGTKAVRLIVGSNSVVQIIANSPDNVITDTLWHHVVVTGAGSGNTITFYVDAVSLTSTYPTSFSGFTAGNVTNKLQLGALVGPSLPINGKENNVMIYNRTLSQTEIRQLYANPYQMFQNARPLKLAV